ncbi:MAG TPA: hypothetical protein PLR20_11925 [Syntrophales bacterium]|nr:hypothetical protein [Syntrophales bacterium]HPI57150.1 hypothetical protein [Syntrophales bacterium]HPN24763.1 hypothetical protein [Syntrophales bacterium]HQM30048.1 hypothetical protein [Syntrophales bacterium]
MVMDKVRVAKREYAEIIMKNKNVVACGVGYKRVKGVVTDEPAVVISVIKKLPPEALAIDDIIPRIVGEAKTDVIETGVIRALQAPTDKWRPAPGGVSIGHIDITAGTLGCLVTRGSELFILSNNHVLANSNQASPGDPIIQPGRYDGGTADDRIAVLEAFVPIHFRKSPSECPVFNIVVSLFNIFAATAGSMYRLSGHRITAERNLVDAAIARPLSSDLVERRILNIGVPKGSGEAVLGTAVKKSGRTTGLTIDDIQQVDATVQVNYGSAGTAVFEDQLIAGAMSQGGDSGSAVLDQEGYVVGLLFAGSDNSTIINRIQNVKTALDVSIAT